MAVRFGDGGLRAASRVFGLICWVDGGDVPQGKDNGGEVVRGEEGAAEIGG